MEMLLLSARTAIDEKVIDRISSLLGRDFDWDLLMMVARRHGLIPLVYRTLSGAVSVNVPPEALGRLRSLAESVRFQNLVCISEVLKAMQAFAATGVVATPYKGPALALYLYGDVGLRQFNDIDFLVRPSDAIKARHALIDLGFTSHRQYSARAEQVRVLYHCYFTFTSEKRTVVDLNWRQTPTYWRLPSIQSRAWDRMDRLSLGGFEVPWFVPEDLLFTLYLHGSKHQWASLKWLVDVAELLRLNPKLNWTEILDHASVSGSKRMLLVCLFLAHYLLDAPVPAEVLKRVHGDTAVTSLGEELSCSLVQIRTQAISSSDEVRLQLAFLCRAADRIDTKLACQIMRPFYYVFHHLAKR